MSLVCTYENVKQVLRNSFWLFTDMTSYSWIGYVDFEEADPHIFVGRIEVFDGNGSWPISEYHLRYKQVFPNEMDFREWIDDLETKELLDVDEIIQLFLKQYSKLKFLRLIF